MIDEQREIYARMSPAERVAIGCGLHDFAFERVVETLRRENAELSESELLRRATRRFLGEAAGVL